MHLLQAIGISSKGIVFEETRVALSGKARHFASLKRQGYELTGKHCSRDVFLFHNGNDYRLAHISDDKNTPHSLGAIVENTEEALEQLQQKHKDIFDSGAVGEMALHIPAFRDAQGRFIYLIEPHRADDFFAGDFDVTGA